ncbi:type IV pilus assembly protein PilC [Limimonas halophila]|uniref:Type IV pilus assembly protein PilC n=1 Tax=Limimonas halophila TaxID=1082479 RepID=A0A1G7NM56_9PROT|nr:type II secretion system F family protein [Limimonas halophila]SDF75164.1 type IV pilus assembly protein PilC [Limimonas halophila]
MPTFRYRAISDTGRKVTGKLAAASEADLDQHVEELGYELIDSRRISGRGGGRSFLPQRVRTRELIEFCIDMEELIRAGVPVLDAVQDIRDSTSSDKLRDVLSDVARDLGNGIVLSGAFANHPETFDTLFVGVISAGERSGDLENAFNHLAQHLRWSDEMNKRIRAAARYPAFTLVTTIALAGAMMIFLVPQLQAFLTNMQIELPLMTRALMATSDFVQAFWWLILLVPSVTVMLFVLGYRRDHRIATAIDQLMLRLPVIGVTLRKIAMSRFAHFFTIMYKSGVGILECLETARGVVVNRALANSLADARTRVEQGSTLTDALRETGEFPDMVVRMVRVGEQAGSLDKALESVSGFYDRDVRDAVQQLVDSVQPTLTLVIGALLAWIVLAVLGPMYDSFSKMPI